MFINKIDELIENSINTFFHDVISKNKVLEKVKQELNFVKYQKQLNDILSNYFQTINISDITKVVDTPDNAQLISNIIQRYTAYYLFLTIGHFYKGKEGTFINNIIEISNNQHSYKLKIVDFFNSNNNATLIKLHQLERKVAEISSMELNKISTVKNKENMKSAMVFLNEIGKEMFMQHFRLENIKGKNKLEQAHNIIKTIIFRKLFLEHDKKEVHQILAEVEKGEGEYTFIDIVIPTSKYVDYQSIEEVLDKDMVMSGIANDIYEQIQKDMDEESKKVTLDNKILELVNKRWMVPIVDDFLLYHKDSENYDKFSKDNTLTLKKKKENTKIKYIVNKVERASELYSDTIKNNKKYMREVEKTFYSPLIQRKAVIYNDIEDIRIINKIRNQGLKSMEGNEYYNDLMSYRLYPYLNFRDFKDSGFSLKLNKTIDIARYVSFDADKKYRPFRNNQVQFRIGSRGMTINVVGLFVPPAKIGMRSLKVNQLKDVRKLGSKEKSKNKNKTEATQNGFDATVKYLYNTLIKNKNKSSNGYWVFRASTDNAVTNKYEKIRKMTDAEQMKLLVTELYDYLVGATYQTILDKINKVKTAPYYYMDKFVNKLQKKYISINTNDEFNNKLKKIIYHTKAVPSEDKYDKNEDKFPGLSGDIIKLPIIKKEKKKGLIKSNIVIDSYTYDEELEKRIDIGNAICQHNVTWDKISAYRKRDPNKFTNDLYEFIQQYMIINADDEYVCKSCGTQLNLKKYVSDGAFDNNIGKFVTFSSPMHVPLGDIREYRKLKVAVRSITKIVEKIASFVNIPMLIGSNNNVKWLTRSIVKGVLDIIMVHNKHLKQLTKQNKQITGDGVNASLSQLFYFDLEDSIFIYSSRDRDYFKYLKHNNVIAYTIIIMMLELNVDQLQYIKTDKACNWLLYQKFGKSMFEGITIRKNDKGDRFPITKYPLLCYLLYIFACLCTKYNVWHVESKETKESRRKLLPTIQKYIINTTVNALNSILSVKRNDKTNKIYQILSTKLYNKIKTVFSQVNYMSVYKEQFKSKIKKIGDKKIFVDNPTNVIKLTGKYEKFEYPYQVEYDTCIQNKNSIKRSTRTNKRINDVTCITNCQSGEFHDWKGTSKGFVCINCNIKLKDVSKTTKCDEIANANYKFKSLEKLANRYCKSGDIHQFVYDEGKSCNVCKNCAFESKDVPSKKELNELDRSITELRNKTKNKMETVAKILTNRLVKKQEKITSVINGLKSEYSSNKDHKSDYFYFIFKFIDTLQTIIGGNTNINNDNFYIRDSVYVIDHDYQGNELKIPIVIADKDKKIKFRENHRDFGVNVLYYTDFKRGRVDVYYDAITLMLLGYKESNREIVYLKNKHVYMKINYSVLDMIKSLGYQSNNINFQEHIEDVDNKNKDLNYQQKANMIVSNVNRTRIENIKKTIGIIQRNIFRLKYGYIYNPEEELTDNEKIVQLYQKKLKKIFISSKDSPITVFTRWKKIESSVFFKSIENKVINIGQKEKWVNYKTLANYDYHGNLLLFYMVKEMNNLLSYNQDKFVRTNLAFLLINIIKNSYNLYNKDNIKNDIQIQRFKHILSARAYLFDISQKGHGLEEGGDKEEEISEEQQEENLDAEQEMEVATELLDNGELADGNDFDSVPLSRFAYIEIE